MKSVLLTILGAIMVAGGVGLIYVPAGVIVAGVEMVAGAYVVRYLEAKRR